MRILVFLKEVPDVRVPLEYEEGIGGLRREGVIFQLNPPDRSALEAALRIKGSISDVHITLIQLGGVSGERWIREGLALGCDEGLRIWEEGLEGLGAYGKAFIFARVAELLGFDLILTGNRSLDSASGQVGVILACRLNLPHISSAVGLRLDPKDRSVLVRRGLWRGYQEEIRSSLPLVVTMGVNEEIGRYASFPALLEAMERDVPCWDLAQVGISWEELRGVDSLLIFGPVRFPRPRSRFIPVPDSSLPAFERIRRLLEGALQRRGGKVVHGEEDELVEELFQTLLKGGWLDHLRRPS